MDDNAAFLPGQDRAKPDTARAKTTAGPNCTRLTPVIR
jgi:hypothetical protein